MVAPNLTFGLGSNQVTAQPPLVGANSVPIAEILSESERTLNFARKRIKLYLNFAKRLRAPSGFGAALDLANRAANTSRKAATRILNRLLVLRPLNFFG